MVFILADLAVRAGLMVWIATLLVVDERMAREAISGLPGIRPGRVHPHPGGWSHWVFEAEPDWIFRFPRRPEVAKSLAREISLLGILDGRLSFAVPRFEIVGKYREMPFVGYHRVPGTPVDQSRVDERLAVAIGTALADLHSIPLDAVRPALGVEGSIEEWRATYALLKVQFERRTGPRLDRRTRSAAIRGFDRFLDEEVQKITALALVHRDLGSEHILVDSAAGRLTGIIDFEEATIGDPAIDFAGLWLQCGPDRTQRIASSYQGIRGPGSRTGPGSTPGWRLSTRSCTD